MDKSERGSSVVENHAIFLGEFTRGLASNKAVGMACRQKARRWDLYVKALNLGERGGGRHPDDLSSPPTAFGEYGSLFE